MNAAGNPLAMLSGVSGLPDTIKNVAKAPLERWNQSSTTHKVVAASAGVALAYYLRKKGMADAAVAVAGVAAAYGTSMVLHVPSVTRGVPAQAAGALPPAQVAAMNQQAQAAMNNQSAGADLSGALGAPSHVPGTAGPIPMANGNGNAAQSAPPVNATGKWALLAANL